MWQKAVFEKADRLVRLHAAIEHVEGRVQMPQHTTVMLHFHDEGGVDIRAVPVERGHLLALLKGEEGEIITDLARILRQVSEP